jgi:hypothetical protein
MIISAIVDYLRYASGICSSSNAKHRALLLSGLGVLFARRQHGRSKKWTAERLCQLLADVAAYKRKNPKASDPDVRGWLYRHNKSYAHESSEALRRALQDARNPKRNSDLAQMAGLLARHVTENWTTALDETATVWARGRVIEDADELWGPRK